MAVGHDPGLPSPSSSGMICSIRMAPYDPAKIQFILECLGFRMPNN